MILIDDRPYERTCPAGKTVRDLAQEICETSTGRNRRMVVAVFCEGRAVEGDALNAVLEAPAGSFEQLELQTQPVAALVRATLDQALSLLQDAGHIRNATADLLEGGDYPGAMRELQKLLDIWRQLQQSLVFSAEAVEIDLNMLKVGDCDCADLVKLMKATLGDLREAMQNQDTVLMGDLLRYELEDVFDKWAGLLAGIQSIIQPARE